MKLRDSTYAKSYSAIAWSSGSSSRFWELTSVRAPSVGPANMMETRHSFSRRRAKDQTMIAFYTERRLESRDPFAIEPGSLSAVLAHNWWAVALRGVLGILFGIVALV